ncbi:hypothetical protein JCM11251_005153 [Rhodosporidiobolus azoricus]
MTTPSSPGANRPISSPSFSPPPPSSTPLFFSPNPRPKSAASSSPSSSTTPAPSPRRRAPVSATTGSSSSFTSDRKRSPAVTRAWNRRLSFSSASLPIESRSSTQQGGQAGLVFDFDAPRPWKGKQDPFDLSEMAIDVEGIGEVGYGNVTPRTAERRMKRLPAESGWQRRETSRTRINDLPDEILLRIFGFLNDTLGFRPLSSRISVTPEWYNPPIKIAIVCKRWLPLARHIFYRYLKISHVSRIRLLHHTFTSTDLSLLVRHLSIDLPSSAIDELGKPWPITSSPSTSIREADSDLDLLAPGRTTPIEGHGGDNCPLTPSQRKKLRRPLLPQDQLRAVFQSCSELLSLEISGVPPALLFTSSYSALTFTKPNSPGSPSYSPSALHHLHLLRLSTVTSLTLCARPSYALFSPSTPLDGHITSTTLRDALLALTGLTTLTLKGYVSSTSPGETLDFAPTRTPSGLLARPLPSRARARALLPLRTVKLVDCALSPADFLALVKQVRPGSLRSLTLEEAFDPALARRRGRDGLWSKPSVEVLNTRGVREVFGQGGAQAGLTALRVTLHNYPVVIGGDAITSPGALPVSPPRRRGTRALPLPASGTDTTADLLLSIAQEGEAHLLDPFISSLSFLTSLDLGGLIVTPLLFAPAPPPAMPGYPASADPPPPSLPPSVKRLTLRSCPAITPTVMRTFLLSLPASPSPLGKSNLSSLDVHGSTEYGWASPILCWEVQRACWDRGVRWSSGRQGGGVVWTGVPPASSAYASPAVGSAGSRAGAVAPSSERSPDDAAGFVLSEGTRVGDLVDLAGSSPATADTDEEATTTMTTALTMEAQQGWVGQGMRLGRADGRW